jgi:hypothetical protein
MEKMILKMMSFVKPEIPGYFSLFLNCSSKCAGNPILQGGVVDKEEGGRFVLFSIRSSFHCAFASHCLTGSRVVAIAAAISFKVNPAAFNSKA